MKTNSDRPALPKSLRKKRNKRMIVRILVWFVLFAFCLSVVLLWGEIVFPMPTHKNFLEVRHLYYALFLLLPFLVTGIPVRLIDRSWSGTVTAVIVEENMGTYTRSLGRPQPYRKHDLVLLIEKDNGKKTEYIPLSLGVKYKPWDDPPNVGKIAYHTEEYREGDRVHKYYGFQHLYVSHPSSQQTRRCIVCGSKNEMQEHVCWYCSSELIGK